jgi:hypothetical protein
MAKKTHSCSLISSLSSTGTQSHYKYKKTSIMQASRSTPAARPRQLQVLQHSCHAGMQLSKLLIALSHLLHAFSHLLL